ncbi:MAG: hypothetical protein OXR66_06160 [Candidatus Woesearchaeota archaeon]|nr:hypothetical protein [Candidatus Woesearchaeota archaeon]
MKGKLLLGMCIALLLLGSYQVAANEDYTVLDECVYAKAEGRAICLEDGAPRTFENCDEDGQQLQCDTEGGQPLPGTNGRTGFCVWTDAGDPEVPGGVAICMYDPEEDECEPGEPMCDPAQY